MADDSKPDIVDQGADRPPPHPHSHPRADDALRLVPMGLGASQILLGIYG
ncbi:hypothetical protein NG799_03315 [Laspinema sp. D1]|jgi:hypothetical protein|uniref:Uncharacterized protein n=1 Tax=Laspinema palackyanum D2a TaxID=2953684 RepID=A0ABT2MPK2_9CYAN|nr:hypothetical protein [Laspinema sp. D2a]